MKHSHNALLLILSVFFLSISCSKDKSEIPEPAPEPINGAPLAFTVEVSGITKNSAQIKWSKATDPENDKVTYSVVLVGKEVAASLDSTKHLVGNLTPETRYDGYILAKDTRNNSTRTDFSFTTDDAYIKFNKKFAKDGAASIEAVSETSDGGYVLAGSTYDYSRSLWVTLIMKIDSLGGEQWSMTHDMSSASRKVAMTKTKDEGFIITTNKSLLRVDPQGRRIWQTALDKDIVFKSVLETDDNGFVAVGHLGETKHVAENIRTQAIMVKFDAVGNVVWETRYGTTLYTNGTDVLQIPSGGYLMLVEKETTGIGNRDEAYSGRMNIDFGLIQTDPQGAVVWEKTYGDNRYDFAEQLKATRDGGFVIAGSSWGTYDFSEMRVIKVDKDGNGQWEQSFNNGHSFQTNAIALTDDGGYAMTGYLKPNSGSSFYLGFYKLGASGEKQWEKSYGKNFHWNYGSDLIQTPDKGFIVAGYSAPLNEKAQVWVLKLNPSGESE